jgi:hypothetical protein
MAAVIGDDFTIDYFNKRIWHSANTNVYSVNELYSYLQNTFDDLAQLDDTIPMSAQTPTDYTLINGWFMNEQRGSGTPAQGCIEFLKGGAIKSTGYNGEVYELTFGTYPGALDTSDIGLTLTDGGTHTGIILDYNDTDKKIWVRKVVGTFANSDSLTITGGTSGTYIVAAAAGVDTGENIWPNIYTLGSIDQTFLGSGEGQQIYVVQNEIHLDEWWPVDRLTNAARQIDILVKTMNMGDPLTPGTAIDSGNLTIFLRHYPSGGTTGGNYVDLYDNFNLSGVLSGRNAVPLATANDLNNLSSQATVAAYNGIDIYFVNGRIAHGAVTSGPFTLYETVTSDNADSGTAVMIADGSGPGPMTLANVTGTFASGDVITGSSSNATTTASGNLTIAVDADRTTPMQFTSQEPNYDYSVIVDCDTKRITEVYEYLKYYTRIGATGSSFKTYMVQRTAVATWAINILDGEQYIEAYEDLYAAANTFSPVKQSPFGTLAGGKLFGARGVFLRNMDSRDVQQFQLIDSAGTTRTPPVQVAITVTNTLASDRVAVFLSDGTQSTTILKTQYTSHAANNTTGNATFVIQEAIPSDTPMTGSIRIIKTNDYTATRETRHTYTSWDGATKTFSGVSPILPVAYAGTDKAYVPYLDVEATTSSVTTTVTYSTTRNVLVRVRRHTATAILPFETPQQITNTGMSQATIRTTDSITVAS